MDQGKGKAEALEGGSQGSLKGEAVPGETVDKVVVQGGLGGSPKAGKLEGGWQEVVAGLRESLGQPLLPVSCLMPFLISGDPLSLLNSGDLAENLN